MPKNSKLLKKFILSLAFFIFSFFLYIPISQATNVSLDPEISQATPGDDFQVKINVDSLEDLSSIDFRLNYTDGDIDLITADLGEAFTVLCPEPLFGFSSSSGEMYFHAERAISCAPYNFITPKTLAILTFHTSSSSVSTSTALEFSDYALYSNPASPTATSAVWNNGIFLFEDVAPPALQIVSPSSATTTSLSASSTQVIFSGIATDNFGIFSVTCSLDGSPPIESDDSVNWLCAFYLNSGVNNLVFVATDNTGFKSTSTMLVDFSKIPQIISPTVAPSTNSATITWTNDEQADAKIFYGQDSSLTSSSTQYNASFAINHSLLLNALSAGTRYYYKIQSTNIAGNANESTILFFDTSSSGGGGGGGGGGGALTTPALTIAPTTIYAFDVSALSITYLMDNTAKIQWINPADNNLAGIKIIKKIGKPAINHDDTSAFLLFKDVGESVIDKNLDTGQDNYYSVFCYDKNNNYSTGSSIKLSALNPAAATNTPLITERLDKRQAEYKNLSGFSSLEADNIASDEAQSILDIHNFINLTEMEANIYIKIILGRAKELEENNRFRLAYFIKWGTKSTFSLGAGERGGVLNSYYSAFGHLPKSLLDWKDVIKIGNGRWTNAKNLQAEQKNRIVFKKIYRRLPDIKNNHDNAAVNIITYGLRPTARSMKNEQAAIRSFAAIFKKTPISADDWDIIRAIANSGAKK